MTTNFVQWLAANKLIILVAVAFSAYAGFNLYKENTLRKEIISLKTEITSFKDAQLEAIKKQDEYIQSVYTNLTNTNTNINEVLKGQKDEIEKWTSELAAAIADSVQQSTERAIDSSTTKAAESARTALRDTADILATKFSNEVSRELIEIIADAERTRLALKQCIEWSDTVKQQIEQQTAYRNQQEASRKK